MTNRCQKIINHLTVSDDVSTNRLEITSPTLDIRYLKALGIEAIKTKEGINVQLDEQKGYLIYKTEADALMYIKSKPKDECILILENQRVYYNTPNNTDDFIENILIYLEYRELFLNVLADYINKAEKEFILITSESTLEVIEYSVKPLEYFYGIPCRATLKNVKELLTNNEEWTRMFKYLVIRIASKQPKETRLANLISFMPTIIYIIHRLKSDKEGYEFI